MGFRVNSYATVWSVESTRPNVTKVRLSTSRRNKQTGEYEQDFSGFCNFVGNCAVDALQLREKDRIKLGDVDVTSRYDREAHREYINYTVFSFERAESGGATRQENVHVQEPVEENPVDSDSNELPF